MTKIENQHIYNKHSYLYLTDPNIVQLYRTNTIKKIFTFSVIIISKS